MYKLLLLILPLFTLAQFEEDTVKVKTSWYMRISPYSVYTGPGLFKDKHTQNFETGFSHGVIDLGLSAGRVSFRKDTTGFVEAKVTMDGCQYGRFSNEYSVGIGYVHNPNSPLMLDVSTTIFVQLSEHWGLGTVTGYYDISGKTQGYNYNYFGLYLRYGLLRDGNGILRISKSNKVHHHF